jgi:predicted unusual protein kinase regulating ubiquinone biosynthesis (AarF/ABC1/UbiB family)
MLRTVAKRTAYTVTGTTLLGGTAGIVYTNTEHGKGLKRQIQFWSQIGPIVASYYIQASSYSPYVKYQKYLHDRNYHDDGNDNDNDKEDGISNSEERYKKKRKETLQQLHNKHAPELLHILQSLRGLYIKLGQVLSVSALPLPQEYKKQLRTLQSDVPGHEDYDTVIRAIIERELDVDTVEDVFDAVEPIPCGAASIGQAHRARLKKKKKKKKKIGEEHEHEQSEEFDVVIKVQYPQASWQVPADISCIGQLLTLCVYADLVDETSARLSYDEFARQFLSELDYDTETNNLKDIYESSLDKVHAPYYRRNVIVPKVYEDLCTKKVITMEYIPGPKIEEEARKQLELLGIRTDRSIKDIVKEAANDVSIIEEGNNGIGNEEDKERESGDLIRRVTTKLDKDPQHQNKLIRHATKRLDLDLDLGQDQEDQKAGNDTSSKQKIKRNWKATTFNAINKIVGVDTIFWTIRTIRRIIYLSQASTVTVIQTAPKSIIPTSWNTWAKEHETAAAQAARLNLTKEWIDALFDVHGHQIFELGCFNADCHPGNILVVEDKKVDGTNNNTSIPSEKLGLIDFGQCKRLTPEEQLLIARLILSVAKNESDLDIANNFRRMGIKTKEDSSEFIAKFSKLMFGSFSPEHMSHQWHLDLHKLDQVLYFPKELSMVCRTSLLLRGLAVSLQMNCSVGEQWQSHAQAVVDRDLSGKK